MKNDQDARDVVHDAFVRALRSGSEVANVKTWFLAAVRNVAFTALKKRRPFDGGENVLSELLGDVSDPERLTIQKADLERIRVALLLMSEEHREVFVLREIEELSYQELSETLRVPAGTVMSRLARARAKLADLLRQSNQTAEGARHD